MKSFIFTFAFSTIALSLAACSASFTAPDSPLGGNQTLGTFPAYKETPPSGQAFGATWTAAKGGYRKDPQSGGISVKVVSAADDECSVGPAKTAYATVVLPDLHEGVDHVTESMKGQVDAPLVFIDPSASPALNLIADRSRVAVSRVAAGSFQLALYAYAQEFSGRTSEINGKINVVNCDTRMTFADWQQFAGDYKLVKFDGRPHPDGYESSRVEDRSGDFRDGAGKDLRDVDFQLFDSVGSGSSSSLNLGPIEGLGNSQRTVNGADTVSVYEFAGPVIFRGISCQLTLHLQVTEHAGTNGKELQVSYSAEIPGYVAKTSHSFVLQPW